MLYNTDWIWHSVERKEDMSIDSTIRKINTAISYQMNVLYTGIVEMKKISQTLGIDIGG